MFPLLQTLDRSYEKRPEETRIYLTEVLQDFQSFSKYSSSIGCTSNLGLRLLEGDIYIYRFLFLGRLIGKSRQHTVHNKLFMFLSSKDVSRKMLGNENTDKNTLSNDSDSPTTCTPYNKTMYSNKKLIMSI